MVQAKLGQEEAAKESFFVVLNNPKASPRVFRMLAYRLLEAGRIEESIEAYTRLLRGQEATYGDWNNRGVAYFRGGDWKQARKDLVQAYDVGSDRPEALSNLGRCYVETGHYQEAVSVLLRALEIDPNFHPALLNATVLYGEYLDDMEKATAYLQLYLDAGGTIQRGLFRGWLTDKEGDPEEPPS
jgi:tetratricopeptide (TPR) repeat protein